MLHFLHPPTQIQQPEIQTLEVWEGKDQPLSDCTIGESGVKATAWGQDLPAWFMHHTTQRCPPTVLRAVAGRDLCAHQTSGTWGPGRGINCPRSHSGLVAKEGPEPRSPNQQIYHLPAKYTTLPPEVRGCPQGVSSQWEGRFTIEGGQRGHKALMLCDLGKGISTGRGLATPHALCMGLSGLRALALGSNKFGSELCVTLDRWVNFSKPQVPLL